MNNILQHNLDLASLLPFWQKLTSNEQILIQQEAMYKTFPSQTTIYDMHNECLGLVFVLSGELRVYLNSDSGKEITLYRLAPNELCVLSANCILKNINFEVYIDTETTSELLVIPANTIGKIMSNNIFLENFTYKLLAERFSDVMWAMQQILFMSFDKRLAIFLLDEINKQHTNCINLTHEQIAKYIGSAREVVTRMLKYFSQENIVKLSRGEIFIINKEKLKQLTT